MDSRFPLATLFLVALAGIACDRAAPGSRRDLSSAAPAATKPATPPTSGPAGNLVFLDEAGNVVATCDLELPRPLPPAGQSFAGSWRLLASEKSFPAEATRRGAYSGSVHDGEISIDLNPGTADNNLVLGGTMTGGTLRGTWYHATFSGGKPMGTFSLTAPSPDRQ